MSNVWEPYFGLWYTGAMYASPQGNAGPEQSFLGGLSGNQVIFQFQPVLVPLRDTNSHRLGLNTTPTC